MTVASPPALTPKDPPGPPLPAFVQTLLWTWRPLELMHWCEKRYGDTFTLHFLGHRFVFTTDPAAVRRCFAAAPEEFSAREIVGLLKPLVGENSLFLLDGGRHRHQRKMMLPPFHGERMQLYADVVMRATQEQIDSWPHDRPFRLQDAMQGITLDVIVQAVFGISRDDRIHQVRAMLTAMIDAAAKPVTMMLFETGEIRVPWFLRPFEPWLPLRDFIRSKKQVDAMLASEIARRHDEGSVGNDILSMLAAARDENGEPLSDAELRDEMLTLLLAGHETSATTLAWLFCLLLQHPRVLERVRRELDAVVGAGPLGASHVPDLVYLDAVIKETLRVRPILPIVSRKLKVPMDVGKHLLPAGSCLTPCVYLTHRRPDLWADADVFEPQRFIDQRAAPTAWFPFGGGVRRCLGMGFAMFEMKLIVANILHQLDLRLIDGYVPRVTRRNVTLAPTGGVPVLARARPVTIRSHSRPSSV